MVGAAMTALVAAARASELARSALVALLSFTIVESLSRP